MHACKVIPDFPTKGMYQYLDEMKKMFFLAAIFMLLLATGCQTDQPLPGDAGNKDDITEQLSNQEHVTGGLNPFKLIDNPLYTPVHEIDYFNDNEMVFITKASGDLQVFPLRHMHVEVVNDVTNGVWMAITYCPITRSAINWNRVVGIDTMLLTASGYLYKDNLMPLDVNSGNIWSQMLMRRFQGNANQGEIFAFRELSIFPLIETTWGTVKEYFPEARVYTGNSDMKSVEAAPLDQQLGVIGKDAVETFSLDMFGEITLYKSAVNPGGMIVVAGSSEHHFMLAFRTTYSMEPVQGKFPVIMKDETGTMWDIFGEGMMGERAGEKLESPLYYTAADWAWRDLYEQVHLFEP
jgi:hypothetical protein